MKHQVEFLKSMGITAEFTGEDQRDEEAKLPDCFGAYKF